MSKDGCNWQVLPTSFQANCLQFADGYFYAFGSQDARSGLAVSTEGLYWDFREAPGASAFAVGPGQIIVVGELGLVREGASSRPRLAWRNVTGVDDLALEINGTRVGGQYELQASPDLRAWATRLPLAGSVETIAVTNLLDLAASARFFRVLKLP
jgi:hypothetical protein